jgi:hypothetical protein
MQVTGRVQKIGVSVGTAHARIELEGTSAALVKQMFLTEAPDKFFPSAKSWLRERTKEGGQQFLENPLFPVPIMFSQINPNDEGVKGHLVGLISGGGQLRIWDEGGRTYIEEVATKIHLLNPTDLPPWKLAEAVPVFGMFARGMRRATNAVIDTPLALVHAALISHDNAQTIVRTLNEMQSRGSRP